MKKSAEVKRVAVGISGGVDSSVAAILMQEQGYELFGVHMLIHPGKEQAAIDAKKVAEKLNIPFYQINLIEAFNEIVASYLSKLYLKGKTPNPCVICNREIKFGLLLEETEKIAGKFDFFVTGHYAQSIKLDNGRWTIKKGSDKEKDQAYFLSMLSQNQISKIQFPLFGMTKDEVRVIAKRNNLFTSSKKDSQDLCTGSYLEHIHESSGEGSYIQQLTGKSLGKHKGVEHYTVGQRRGLNIATGYPVYVTQIDHPNNIVYIGKDEELFCDKMKINSINWVGEAHPSLPFQAQVKIRYRDQGTQAQLMSLEEDEKGIGGVIHFNQPVRAITPGQLAVAYVGDKVVFSGFIEKSL